jgi:hypothetical protein
LILLLKQQWFAPLFDQVANAALAVQKVEMKQKWVFEGRLIKNCNNIIQEHQWLKQLNLKTDA